MANLQASGGSGTLITPYSLPNGMTALSIVTKKKIGEGTYVTRIRIVVTNYAHYGILSSEKIKALNKVDYNKARDALGLESGYDFNIRIVSDNGTELLRYGKAFDTARDVVSFSRNVLVYPNPDLGVTDYIKAKLTVYVFR